MHDATIYISASWHNWSSGRSKIRYEGWIYHAKHMTMKINFYYERWKRNSFLYICLWKHLTLKWSWSTWLILGLCVDFKVYKITTYIYKNGGKRRGESRQSWLCTYLFTQLCETLHAEIFNYCMLNYNAPLPHGDYYINFQNNHCLAIEFWWFLFRFILLCDY